MDDNIKVSEMVLNMSTSKMYFLVDKSMSLFEITVASYDLKIVYGVSFFEKECSNVGEVN